MNITVHRGTHQIGGSAIEISTTSTRIVFDFGNELSLEEQYIPTHLDIDGVTGGKLNCDGIVISHYHMDHLGQLTSALPEIPLYMGELSKEIALIGSEYQDKDLYLRLLGANTFRGGESFSIGDIRIRPLVIDHSAADSYMFVIEAEGKRILYTGDFRMHGLRHHVLEKIVNTYIGEVDVLITEEPHCLETQMSVYLKPPYWRIFLHIFKTGSMFLLCVHLRILTVLWGFGRICQLIKF